MAQFALSQYFCTIIDRFLREDQKQIKKKEQIVKRVSLNKTRGVMESLTKSLETVQRIIKDKAHRYHLR